MLFGGLPHSDCVIEGGQVKPMYEILMESYFLFFAAYTRLHKIAMKK